MSEDEKLRFILIVSAIVAVALSRLPKASQLIPVEPGS